MSNNEFLDLIKGEVGKKVTIQFRKVSDVSKLSSVTLAVSNLMLESNSGYWLGGSAYSTHSVSNISQKNRSMTNSNGKGKRKGNGNGKGKNKSKKQNATKKLNRH